MTGTREGSIPGLSPSFGQQTRQEATSDGTLISLRPPLELHGIAVRGQLRTGVGRSRQVPIVAVQRRSRRLDLQSPCYMATYGRRPSQIRATLRFAAPGGLVDEEQIGMQSLRERNGGSFAGIQVLSDCRDDL